MEIHIYVVAAENEKKGIYLSTEHDIAQSASLNKNTKMCGKKLMRAIMMLLHRRHGREQGQGCKYFIKKVGAGYGSSDLPREGFATEFSFVGQSRRQNRLNPLLRSSVERACLFLSLLVTATVSQRVEFRGV